MNGRVLPNTQIGARDVSWVSFDEVKDNLQMELVEYATQTVSVSYESNLSEFTLEELGIQIDIPASLADIERNRVMKVLNKSPLSLARMGRQAYEFEATLVIDSTRLEQTIGRALGPLDQPAINAQLNIVKGRASIEPGEDGRGYDLEQVSQQVQEHVRKLSRDVISINLQTIQAQITIAQIQPLLLQAQVLLAEPVILKVDSNQFDIQSDELGQWLKYDSGANVIATNDQEIKQTISRIVQTYDQPSQPEKVIGNTDHIVEVGQVGKRLDQEKALATIKESYFSTAPARSIELATLEEQPERISVSSNAAPSNLQGKIVRIVLSEQRLYAWENGKLVYTTLISSGLAGTPTPIGTFAVRNKILDHVMAGPGYYLPNVPHSMYFSGSYALHGAYWHNDFGNPRSHGCVNLPLEEAAWLFDWATIGTSVEVRA